MIAPEDSTVSIVPKPNKLPPLENKNLAPSTMQMTQLSLAGQPNSQQTTSQTEPSICQRFKNYVNTEEYWPLWLGILWFFVILGYSFWGSDMPRFSSWKQQSDLNKTFTVGNFSGILLIMAAMMISVSLAHQALNKAFGSIQYILLLAIVFVCSIIGSNASLKASGLGTSIFCIFFGITLRLFLCKNVQWLKTNIYDLEFFIKISIVLLAINLRSIGVIGAKALMVSWVETIIIIPIIYCIGHYLIKMDKQEALVTSCTSSVCGSSAAMTIGDCVKLDKDSLTSVIATSSLLTVPLIPTMPLANISQNVLGAWVGGSVDSTGAVIATASLRSTSAVQIAVIIKMLQNILIGVIALFVTFLWQKTCNLKILWLKFPKFVLGFIFVAIITSVMPDSVTERLTSNCLVISEWFSAVSFVEIGFEIDLITLCQRIRGHNKILILYIVGQLIDIATTFGMAYLFMEVVS